MTPEPGQIYKGVEFTVKVVKVTDTAVWYEFIGENKPFLFTYPCNIDTWNGEVESGNLSLLEVQL